MYASIFFLILLTLTLHEELGLSFADPEPIPSDDSLEENLEFEVLFSLSGLVGKLLYNSKYPLVYP